MPSFGVITEYLLILISITRYVLWSKALTFAAAYFGIPCATTPTKIPTNMHNPSTSSSVTPDSLSASAEVRPFDQSTTSVRINGDSDEDGEGESFQCDEEPHMLSPELGYGYFPLQLTQTLRGGKLEIVRKLGWGLNSSVWLARVHGYIYFIIWSSRVC